MRKDLAVVWDLYLQGQVEPAAQACRQRVEADEDDGDAWELLGLAMHDQGRAFEAADALERASLLVPLCDQARIALAASYGALQRTELARDLYLQLALGGQLELDLMLQVAAGLEATDAPQMALEVCQRAAEIDDSVAQVHYDMGYYAALSGYPSYATEASIRRAVSLAPDNVNFRIGLITLLIRMNRSDEAIAAAWEIEPEQFAEINCRCCLIRLCELLRQHNTSELLEHCQQRLTVLEDAGQAAANRTGDRR